MLLLIDLNARQGSRKPAKGAAADLRSLPMNCCWHGSQSLYDARGEVFPVQAALCS